MFYQTTVSSLVEGGVIDAKGKKLSFIGNKLLKVGDVVWTDGNVIFGHTPIRGGGLLFTEKDGIPVLGDDDLRGYFDKNGNFKKYDVVQDDWIVNDHKKFAHGQNEFNGEKVIDTEIAEDGGVYKAVKKVTELSEDTDDDFYYRYRHVGLDDKINPEYDFYSMLYYDTSYFIDYTNRNSYSFWITAQNADFNSVNGEITRECKIIIYKDNEEIETVTFNDVVETIFSSVWHYIDIDVELYKHVSLDNRKSRAVLQNFKILSASDWTAIIEIELWLERDWFYTATGTNPRNILDASTATHMHFLLKVTSHGETEQLFEHAEFTPFVYIDTEYKSFEDLRPAPTAPPRNTFPYKVFVQTGGYGRLVDGKIVDMYPGYLWAVYWNSRYWAFAPDYDNGIEEITDGFTFPVQDDYQARIINSGSDIGNWRLDSIYDGDKKIFDIASSGTDAHKWNMSLASLKSGKFLFGIHDGALYKIDSNGNATQVGDGLKNFRLRELKKISKAKK